jgi:hypothetical protein
MKMVRTVLSTHDHASEVSNLRAWSEQQLSRKAAFRYCKYGVFAAPVW